MPEVIYPIFPSSFPNNQQQFMGIICDNDHLIPDIDLFCQDIDLYCQVNNQQNASCYIGLDLSIFYSINGV